VSDVTADPTKGRTASASQPGAVPRDPGAAEDAATAEGLREAILAASAVLFDEVGFHNASVALIAERASTTKSLVYQYFPMKHDILFAIHDAWMDELLASARRSTLRDANVPDAVREIFRDVMRVIHDHTSHVRAYLEYYHELPPDLQKKARLKRDEYAAFVEGVVSQGIQSGVFREQSAKVASYALFGMANWGYQWYRPDGPLSYEPVAEQLSDIYLRGMLAET
jgi:AcrR family transcriptional regulator